MKLQFWRNATCQLNADNSKFLIDPMLGKKGSFGVFPWTNDDRENPLVELPFSDEEIADEISSIDAVFVSHLHPDHWDEAAVKLINTSTPIFCPASIAEAISSYGFQNIKPMESESSFNTLQLSLTSGQHGTGEIGQKMGRVNGFVLQHENNKIYIAGDTIWCQEVKEAIDTHKPQHIIVAGGAATFAIGHPVTMTAHDIKAVAEYAQNSTIWITHLEAVSPCKENRAFLADYLESNNLQKQCRILADGEEVELHF